MRSRKGGRVLRVSDPGWSPASQQDKLSAVARPRPLRRHALLKSHQAREEDLTFTCRLSALSSITACSRAQTAPVIL